MDSSVFVGIDVSQERSDIHARPSQEDFAVAKRGTQELDSIH